jgi:predicted aspartyl protease
MKLLAPFAYVGHARFGRDDGMLRYRYSEEFSIPAPFVHAFVSNPSDGSSTDQLPAQIDSGADRTVIPSSIIDQLRLTPVRQLAVAGLGGDVQYLDTFFVVVQIRGRKPSTVEVVAAEHEPFVLIGRDVLNEFRLVLDGPKRILEIEE